MARDGAQVHALREVQGRRSEGRGAAALARSPTGMMEREREDLFDQ